MTVPPRGGSPAGTHLRGGTTGYCRRNFYIEVPELARMGEEEVEEYRAELDGIKVRGKNVPKPIKNWHQVRQGCPCA